MLTNILSLIHNATTLLFGVYASAAFLGVRLNRKNNLHLLIFSCLTGVVYALSFLLYGTSFTEQVYPLSSHIPVGLFRRLCYKDNFVLAILSVVAAYLCVLIWSYLI